MSVTAGFPRPSTTTFLIWVTQETTNWLHLTCSLQAGFQPCRVPHAFPEHALASCKRAKDLQPFFTALHQPTMKPMNSKHKSQLGLLQTPRQRRCWTSRRHFKRAKQGCSDNTRFKHKQRLLQSSANHPFSSLCLAAFLGLSFPILHRQKEM